jgi:hypothetical protein
VRHSSRVAGPRTKSSPAPAGSSMLVTVVTLPRAGAAERVVHSPDQGGRTTFRGVIPERTVTLK